MGGDTGRPSSPYAGTGTMTAQSDKKKPAEDASEGAKVRRRVAHVARSGSAQSPVLLMKDAERTQADILAEATKEFSRKGYSGGRVNDIAKRTRTSKRMIYYYYGSKEGLYKAVLFEHYRRLRADEGELNLDQKPPLEALKQLIHFTFDWYLAHAEQVPLVMVENIHRGSHIADLPTIEPLNTVVIGLVDRICKRGVEEGSIRPGLRAIDIYMSIAATSFFNISNRYTFKAIFGHDMTKAAEARVRRDSVTEMVLRYVAVDPDKQLMKRGLVGQP
jgi:AcrR family transcriptional regulator